MGLSTEDSRVPKTAEAVEALCRAGESGEYAGVTSNMITTALDAIRTPEWDHVANEVIAALDRIYLFPPPHDTTVLPDGRVVDWGFTDGEPELTDLSTYTAMHGISQDGWIPEFVRQGGHASGYMLSRADREEVLNLGG